MDHGRDVARADLLDHAIEAGRTAIATHVGKHQESWPPIG